mgnify:CR=1 FL=1
MTATIKASLAPARRGPGALHPRAVVVASVDETTGVTTLEWRYGGSTAHALSLPNWAWSDLKHMILTKLNDGQG